MLKSKGESQKHMSVLPVKKSFNYLYLLTLYIFGKRIDQYAEHIDHPSPATPFAGIGWRLTSSRYKARYLRMKSHSNRFAFFFFFSFRFFRSACGLGVCV